MNVSIIIPAHNAETTIAATLDSLGEQTFAAWEAIVVDDGSTDGTASVVKRYAAHDPRIRLCRQPNKGVSQARNTGISLARFDWLLFLDADDLIMPSLLERLTGELLDDPALDAVYCGWVRLAPDGTRIPQECWNQSGDMFETFARLVAFAIHCCIVRRALVESVGRFDTSFRTCEDWDLWQRIARTGANFGCIPDVLALYCMRPASASIDGRQMLLDGLRVLAQAQAPDPRVPHPHPSHANGLRSIHLSTWRLGLACWPAGLLIGCGEDPRGLLELLQQDRDPGLDPRLVAQSLFRAIPLPTCQKLDAWAELWPKVEPQIDAFLIALEAHSGTSGLARRARVILERMVLEHSPQRPLDLGLTYAVRVEITAALPDIAAPEPAERLHCCVVCEGRHIGTLELPVCNGVVPSQVLADAIAARFAWQILGWFLVRTIYGRLRAQRETAGLSLWRGDLRLLDGLPANAPVRWNEVHDQIGWTIFLQEIWQRPAWSGDQFYDSALAEPAAAQLCATENWLEIELTEELPAIETSAPALDVVLKCGGALVGVVNVPVEQKRLSPQQLRVALTIASGMELCRVAVRAGILGRTSSDQPASLHARLAPLAQRTKERANLNVPGKLELVSGVDRVGSVPMHRLAAASLSLLPDMLPSDQASVVLGRRLHAPLGTSVSRHAALPAAALDDLAAAASVAGEALIQIPGADESPTRIVYTPDLIWQLPRYSRLGVHRTPQNSASRRSEAGFNGREQFETIFAQQADPWKYTNSYEQTKYAQTLELLPPIQIARALEVGCAEGHFTAQLAPHVGSLIAADISTIALERAAQRCAGLADIQFMHLDLAKDALPGKFDLIVCSEMLYYLGGIESLEAVAKKVAAALHPDGYFLTAHANVLVDEPDQPGFDWDCPYGAKVIGETFARTERLRLVKELRTPLYRIQLFQHTSTEQPAGNGAAPKIVEMDQPTPLPPEIAAQVRWQGGTPLNHSVPAPLSTDRLPILMYHRVAPEGAAATARFRLTPESFEQQIRYLHEAGYTSVSLEDWRVAIETKRPLPGRAVLLTFDDGFLDFSIYAWPILQRYGFSGIVFLVADAIGGSNQWDDAYGERVPLLDWQAIRQLQEQGVEFGSHSASHAALTGLSPAGVVREAARSRAVLERGLGVPVPAFAYPYGDHDESVQHLIGACGYIFGLSCLPGRSQLNDSLLALRRIEVTGSDSLAEFVAKLAW